MSKQSDMKVEYRGGRWYADTTDEFDGTAQGYGYKTEQSLRKARWFFLNKSNIVAAQNSAKEWLKANPEAKAKLSAFLDDLDYWVDDAKDGGGGPSLPRFFDEYREEHGESSWFQALQADAPLAKSVWKFVMDGPIKNR